MTVDPFEMDLTGLGTPQQPTNPQNPTPTPAPQAPVQQPISLDALRAAMASDPMLAQQIAALAQTQAQGAYPGAAPAAPVVPAAPAKTAEELELEAKRARWDELTQKFQDGQITWEESRERDLITMRIPVLETHIAQTAAMRQQLEQQQQQQTMLAQVDGYAQQAIQMANQYFGASMQYVTLPVDQQQTYMRTQIGNLIRQGQGHLLQDREAVTLLLNRAIVEMQNLSRAQNPQVPPANINTLDPNAQGRITQQQQQEAPGDYVPMRRSKV